jgi:hypothetical protein
MTMPTQASVSPPPQPMTIEEAKTYLGWIADNALTGALDRHRAEAAVKAIQAWIRAEDYARQIRDLRKVISDLQRATKRG